MKIGILTFSCAYNFGAILQCYALQEQLLREGHDVHVINYCPDYLVSKKIKMRIRPLIKENITYVRKYILGRNSFSLYEDFVKSNLCLTNKVKNRKDLSEIIHSFDYIIIGSDQIWNTKYNDKDYAWLGDFFLAENKRPKIIFYAASAGDANFSDTEERVISSKLSLPSVKAISVRESKLKNILTELIPYKNVPVVLDPSLMANPIIWKKWQYKIDGRYIVVYQARANDNVYRIAKKLSKELDAKIYSVDFYPNSFQKGINLKVVSPAGFITLIKNALCVITTSFHGTAFSIINETPFYTLKLNDGADERSYDLLCSLGLEDRFIDVKHTPVFSKIDFTNTYDKLNKLRNISQSFLTENIV